MTALQAHSHWLRSLLLIWVMPLLILGNHEVHAEDYDPFRVAKDDFYGVVQTVALWPFSLPSDLADRTELNTLLEAKITEHLESKGLRVLPSSVIKNRWEAAAEAMGGLIDPVTGEGNDEAIALARTLLRIELAVRDGVDATVTVKLNSGHLSVWAKNTSFETDDGGASERYTAWMAGREPIQWLNGPLHSRWINRPTQVLGHRLGVFIHDTAGVELYNVMAPIRYTQVHVRGGREKREETSLLTHQDRIDEVIDILFESIDEIPQGIGATLDVESRLLSQAPYQPTVSRPDRPSAGAVLRRHRRSRGY